MLKKDSYLFGTLIGLVAPVILYFIILVVAGLMTKTGVVQTGLQRQSHLLLSLVANLLPIRYYFVNLRFDKTGRGLLLITFVLAMGFFLLKNKIG